MCALERAAWLDKRRKGARQERQARIQRSEGGRKERREEDRHTQKKGRETDRQIKQIAFKTVGQSLMYAGDFMS